MAIAVDDRFDGLTERGGDEALGRHPQRAEETAPDDGGQLLASQPDKKSHRRSGVGVARLGGREAREQCAREIYWVQLEKWDEPEPYCRVVELAITIDFEVLGS
jgi:hypothetical protein